jgi:hypothetical protein
VAATGKELKGYRGDDLRMPSCDEAATGKELKANQFGIMDTLTSTGQQLGKN